MPAWVRVEVRIPGHAIYLSAHVSASKLLCLADSSAFVRSVHFVSQMLSRLRFNLRTGAAAQSFLVGIYPKEVYVSGKKHCNENLQLGNLIQ